MTNYKTVIINNLLVITVIFFAIDCNINNDNNQNKHFESQVKKDTSLVLLNNKSSNISVNENKVNKNKLKGIWFEEGFNFASFDIQDDSIYFVDYDSLFPYSLENDSLIIFFSHHTGRNKISIFGDSIMILQSGQGETTKYFKE